MGIKKIAKGIVVLVFIFLIIAYIKISNDKIENNRCEIHDFDSIENINFRDYTSVNVSASHAFDADFFKKILQGKNYRKAWQTKIEAPILYLDTLYEGVAIIKEGGGKQTQSLRLQAKNGLQLSLRSINKNPEALVPDFVKQIGLNNIVTDGISGQHPYAALPVAQMSKAIGLLNTNPKVVFLPKQKTLGKIYNNKYGNKLYLLEYENKGNFNWTSFSDFEKIVDNEDLQELKSILKEKLSIDKQQVIKARLFDIVIGDWDRHAKQWGWVITKKDSLYNGVILPTDRDNAFFSIGGIFPSLIENENITPHLQSFEKNIIYLDGLVYDFDVYFLQYTTVDDFVNAAKFIQNNLTDNVINKAFKTWNDTLYDLDAKPIISIIKYRRDNLIKISKKFKSILDSKPLLNSVLKGSDRNDTPGSKIQCFEC